MSKYFNIVCISLLMVATVGCPPPYKPGKVVNDQTVNVTPSQAFDIYKKDTASNFRKLAEQCKDFRYVSELVDASVKLDTEAKKKRSKPIDAMIAEAVGSGELDVAKAVAVLNKVADNLDPPKLTVRPMGSMVPKVDLDGKSFFEVTTPLYVGDEIEFKRKEPLKAPLRESLKQKPMEEVVREIMEEEPVPLPRIPEPIAHKVRRLVRPTSQELLSSCRANVQEYDVVGQSCKQHLMNEHGYTVDQVNALGPRQCKLIHENDHAGIVKPVRVVEVTE